MDDLIWWECLLRNSAKIKYYYKCVLVLNLQHCPNCIEKGYHASAFNVGSNRCVNVKKAPLMTLDFCLPTDDVLCALHTANHQSLLYNSSCIHLHEPHRSNDTLHILLLLFFFPFLLLQQLNSCSKVSFNKLLVLWPPKEKCWGVYMFVCFCLSLC